MVFFFVFLFFVFLRVFSNVLLEVRGNLDLFGVGKLFVFKVVFVSVSCLFVVFVLLLIFVIELFFLFLKFLKLIVLNRLLNFKENIFE